MRWSHLARCHQLQATEPIGRAKPPICPPYEDQMGDQSMDRLGHRGNRPSNPSAVNMHHPGCRPTRWPPFPALGFLVYEDLPHLPGQLWRAECQAHGSGRPAPFSRFH